MTINQNFKNGVILCTQEQKLQFVTQKRIEWELYTTQIIRFGTKQQVAQAGLANEIRNKGTLIYEEYVAEGLSVEAVVDEALYAKLAKYECE